VRKWFARAVVAILLAGGVVAGYCYVELRRNLSYDWGEEERQGVLMCARIRGGGLTPPAHWSPGRGVVTVSVYEVTDPAAQDRIIELVAGMKTRGEVDRRVRLRFYEKEIWIETPKDAKGSWTGYRGPEKLLRESDL
jgi:hypothetical protein